MQRAIPRHFTAYTVTTFFYVGVLSFFYYYQIDKPIKPHALKQNTVNVMSMSLSTFVPEAIIIPEPIKKPIEPEPEIIIPKPLPIVEKPTPKPIVKKKKIIKKKVIKKKKIKKKILKKVIKKPKPIVKKKVIKKKVVKKKIVKKKITKKIIRNKPNPKGKTTQKSKSKQNNTRNVQASAKEVNKFWGRVRAKINKYKYYPRIAKRRGMNGIVKVKFRILANGKVSNISVSGSKIFYNSAKEAVMSAFPMSVKDIPIDLPKNVTIPLHYKIR
ncbi:Ferric siderophore transport system, periplasmic binding protein TonB [hydrothermal vent metagenome]|uniref:Ferric siderophore transport system, periplasmic binding protein TonB n=1 Tax=hydrothermal vent metagenome TaxID=652676 RepID=A0A1W1D0K2_9ZZZZ